MPSSWRPSSIEWPAPVALMIQLSWPTSPGLSLVTASDARTSASVAPLPSANGRKPIPFASLPMSPELIPARPL